MWELLKDLTDFIFALGLFINALFFVPQAIKIYRTKSAKDLSIITFSGFAITQFSAVLYGYFHNDWILIVGYFLSFVSCSTVILLIMKYKRSKG